MRAWRTCSDRLDDNCYSMLHRYFQFTLRSKLQKNPFRHHTHHTLLVPSSFSISTSLPGTSLLTIDYRMSGLWGPQSALDLYLQEEGISTLFFAGVNADQVRPLLPSPPLPTSLSSRSGSRRIRQARVPFLNLIPIIVIVIYSLLRLNSAY